MTFVRVWQYTVDVHSLDEFITAYQPGGHWARLFQKADG
jgi:hypothetical protein